MNLREMLVDTKIRNYCFIAKETHNHNLTFCNRFKLKQFRNILKEEKIM